MAFTTKALATLVLGSSLLLSGCQTAPSDNSAAGQNDLQARYRKLKTDKPNVTLQDAAIALNSSEAQLLALNLGQGVTRLRDEPGVARDIMERVLDLGELQVVSRNDLAVIEVIGVPKKLQLPAAATASTGDPEKDRERALRMRNFAGGYFGAPIDLRLQLDTWKYAFAVQTQSSDGSVHRSLQFFDGSGTALNKVFLNVKATDKAAHDAQVAVYEKLVADFRRSTQDSALATVKPTPKTPDLPDSQIDKKELQLAWNEITDVHQFGRLMSEFKVSRDQAMRFAPEGKAIKLSPKALQAFLTEAAKQQESIMAFVSNPGVTQIFSGKIATTARANQWYVAANPDFNLRIRDDKVSHGWITHRASLTSVDFFDAQGNEIITFFALREPRKPAPESWDKLLNTLPKF